MTDYLIVSTFRSPRQAFHLQRMRIQLRILNVERADRKSLLREMDRLSSTDHL